MDYSSFTVAHLTALLRERDLRVPTRKAEMVQSLQQSDEQRARVEAMRAREREAEEAHRATRVLGLRQQEVTVAHVNSLEYPFSFLRDGQYHYSRECNPMPGQPEEEIGTFPDNIAHYYWIHEGENDECPWLCMCRLENGVYVYYRGECDYTGFDCQGDMKIYASRDPNILLQLAMTAADYDLFIAETAAIE